MPWYSYAGSMIPPLCFVLLAASGLAGKAPDFTAEIRPLLDQHCVKCHGPEKQKSGLRFDVREGAFKAGDSGEKAIVPGQSKQSRLIQLVQSQNGDERMPPKGERLPVAQIELLKRWIDAGAHWPEPAGATNAGPGELVVTDEDRQHWSFLPMKHHPVPRVKNPQAARNPVDHFILARLEEKQLSLSPEASPAKLVRRIYFDLIGLPPTPAQASAFASAHARDAQAAIAKLVNELLASPHYGERWARHWLDVARYADSNGQEGDQDRPTAHHYRDFVIRALNDDMPYDQFVRWQLAGDEFEPDNPLAIAATGFIVAGPHTVLDVPMEEEKIRNRFNELDDMIATTGSAMLGLTLGCARCHDHKYDAVPTRDYYRMLCAFNGGNRAEVPLARGEEVRTQRAAEAKWQAEFDAAKKRLEEFSKPLRKEHEVIARAAKIDALKLSNEDKMLLKNDAEAERAKELAKKYAKELKLEDKDYRAAASEPERAEWDELAKRLKKIEGRKPKPLPTALAFADFGATPRETHLLSRGDFHVKKEPVALGFLTVLSRGKTPTEYWDAARRTTRRDNSTYQRRALAEWLTDTNHGAGTLAARVFVNRVWQHHFGEGLVRTANDFGVQGEAPSHPELLEWLTAQFIASGWKVKPLHRLIMTSSTYLQESAFDSTRAKADPDNRSLWRRRPRRLEAEILRDAILAVSGTLNPQMFGPAFKAPIAAEAIQARNLKDPYPKDIKDGPATQRRTIYMFHKRVVQYPLMQAFDGPDAAASCGRREHTTVAPQALALLNDTFVRARAEDFARRLASAESATEGQIDLAWRLAFGRTPSTEELKAATDFIESQARHRSERSEAKPNSRHLALADFSQALFAMNEFIYVD